MRIIFFGASKFVIPLINTLHKNFDLALVVTTEKNKTDAVPNYCLSKNITYMSVENLSDTNLESKIKDYKSPLGVLAYFGILLKSEFLNLFPYGILNTHPSLLPKYRGTTPGQTAILNGDTKTGVTLIKLDTKMDHGPILDQVEEPILPTDTSETLYERLFIIGADLLLKNIHNYLNDTSTLVSQDDLKATYTKKLTKDTGFIDLDAIPTLEKLDRMIRAYYPWPGVFTKLKIKNEKLKIIKLLPNQKIQVEGKKPMSYKDFINGYPELSEKLAQVFQQ